MPGTVVARPGRSVAALVVLTLLLVPGGASAQEPGVFVDPDSPSGREYVIPLEDARRTGTDAADRPVPTSGAAQAPLFGAGIEPEDGARADTASGETGTGSRESASAGGAGDGDDDGGATAEQPSSIRESRERTRAGRPPAMAVYASQGGSGAPRVILAGAALALLLVGLVAFRLARRGTQPAGPGQPS